MSYHAALESCPHAEFTGIALEFGTRPLQRRLQALRAEQWLANHPDAASRCEARSSARCATRSYDDREAWQAIVYGQARMAVLQALRALGPDAL